MEVSQLSDSVTHAVLGKKESVEMGVSDSATLMHVLSTALYTHPQLAAVREICCNGWDGHIIAGCTDIPLKITIKDNKLSIRDFGPGIPHAKIGEIYGMYGNSTKRHDGQQTGGFGLGSKAPFAYTDNFEVINHNGGEKVIYRVSKSSMAAGGKPSIDTIVRLPSEETGIQVSMDLKNIHDRMKFENLIREVLLLGEIKAIINDAKEPMPTLPLSESPTGYIINSASGTLLSRINLRYGNVVYPVPRNEYYGEIWDQVNRVMNGLWENANVIFMAQPNTVTIAPSREALIFTEGTLAAIKQALMHFSPQRAVANPKTTYQLSRQQVNQLVKAEDPSDHVGFMLNDLALPHLPGTHKEIASGPYAFDAKRATVNYAISRRSLIARGPELVFRRFKQAIFHKKIDKKLGERFLLAAQKWMAFCSGKMSLSRAKGLTADGILRKALHKEITYPLLQSFKDVKFLDVENMHYVMQRYEYATGVWVSPTRINLGTYDALLGFARPRIVLGRSKKAINEFIEDQRQPGNRYNLWGWMIYQLPKSDKHYDSIQKHFEDLGYEVHVHLPVMTRADRAKKSDDPNWVPAAKKPAVKRKGYLTLSSSLDRDGRFLLTNARAKCVTPEQHVTDPMAWVTLDQAGGYPKRFGGFSEAVCQTINTLWGDKIAVVTSTQADILSAKGVHHLSKFVYQHVDNTLSSSADFRRYLAFGRYFKSDSNYRPEGTTGVIRNMLQHQPLMDSLPIRIRFGMSAETEMLLTFFEDNSYRGANDNLPLCNELAGKTKQHPMVQVARDTINKSEWRHYVDLGRLGEVLKNKTVGDPKLAVPYEIVKNLMTPQEAKA